MSSFDATFDAIASPRRQSNHCRNDVIKSLLIRSAGILASLKTLQPIADYSQQRLVADSVDAMFFDWAVLEPDQHSSMGWLYLTHILIDQPSGHAQMKREPQVLLKL